MIQLGKYSTEFEKLFLQKVISKVHEVTQKEIIDSCKNFLPEGFFEGEESEHFSQLILVPYKKLKKAVLYIEENMIEKMKEACFNNKKGDESKFKEPYQTFQQKYSDVARAQKNKATIRVMMVERLGLIVCPYCNREYINHRSGDTAGAQLDHFFSKDEYPIFALTLYNLVPSCGNCNRVKNNNHNFVSPFDDKIKWCEDVVFSYEYDESIDKIDVVINAEDSIRTNIKDMKIEGAYEIHRQDIKELIRKKQKYNYTQIQEFQEILKKENITETEIKSLVFGPKITEESMKTKPLGKMMSDLHKELGIYD